MKAITTTAVALSLVAFVTAGMFIGCSGAKTGDTKSTAGTTNPALKDLPKKQQEALAKLSESDLKLALAQKTCPVGGEALGSMGTPIKVTVKDDQAIFVCCKGCIDTVKEDPEKYLAKIKQK